MSDDGISGKLSRWSQRKLAAKGRGRAAPVALDDAENNVDSVAQQPLQEAKLTPASDPGSAAAPAAADEAPADNALQLPSIDELDANSDYTQFLAKGVPEALKRAALRKLWLSDPVFANLDGLNDYDLNYRVTDKLITAAETAYKAGRGYLEDDETETEADAEQVAEASGEPGTAERPVADASADSGAASEPAAAEDVADADEAVEKADTPAENNAALQKAAGNEKVGQADSSVMPVTTNDPSANSDSDPDPSLKS